MQIKSHNASYDHLPKNPNGRVLDPPRTLRDCSAGPKTILPSMNRESGSPDPGCRWRERVLGRFDSALRDAEDLMLSLPYAEIREKTYNLARVLDHMASSGLERATNRQLSGSQTFTKPRRNREGGSRSRASALPSTIPLVSRALPRHQHESLLISDALFVTLTPISVHVLIAASHTCYESLVAIIMNYTQSLGHETEMQARRALTAALAAMDRISV